MFETSLVRARAEAIRGRASLLTISLAAHSAVIVGAIALSVASTEFPGTAPDQYARIPTFGPIHVPPPLGTPNGGAVRPQQPRPAPTPPAQITAPPAIPDGIVPAPATGTGDPVAGEAGGDAGPAGVPWGVAGGVGDPDAPPATGTVEPVDDTIYYPGGEVKAPVLLHRVEPEYPQIMIRTRMPATVVVRCVIDKFGRVRDPRIIVPALPPFNQSVLTALRQWRYTPGSLRGEAVETYLEVKVDFRLN